MILIIYSMLSVLWRNLCSRVVSPRTMVAWVLSAVELPPVAPSVGRLISVSQCHTWWHATLWRVTYDIGTCGMQHCDMWHCDTWDMICWHIIHFVLTCDVEHVMFEHVTLNMSCLNMWQALYTEQCWEIGTQGFTWLLWGVCYFSYIVFLSCLFVAFSARKKSNIAKITNNLDFTGCRKLNSRQQQT